MLGAFFFNMFRVECTSILLTLEANALKSYLRGHFVNGDPTHSKRKLLSPTLPTTQMYVVSSGMYASKANFFFSFTILLQIL